MTRRVGRYLVGSMFVAALSAVAGCSHYLLAEREPWRHEAELACLNSGVPREIPGRVRISTIEGPGACGIDYPLRVSELGGSTQLGYGDEPPHPQSLIPDRYSTQPVGEGREAEIASVGPVELKPAAALACPIVSALDTWVSEAVQPAALNWFRQPVIEIKQIGSYSCRGMNGNPDAHISEHAFGNALDIAEFDLADGRRITVQYGWNGTPEERGFLRDVQAGACRGFTTVLAPGANVYHYNHIHVDLMRRASGRHVCEPAVVPGEVAAARAGARYAAQQHSPDLTGSIIIKRPGQPVGYSGHRDDRQPFAAPGED